MPSKHPNLRDQRQAISWARGVLAHKESYAILDTETTGVRTNDEIIELAVIDLDGKPLFQSRFLPIKRKSIPTEASSIHGIRYSALKACPKFYEASEQLCTVLGKRSIITYNARFDARLYSQTCQLAFQHFGISTPIPSGQWICAMLEYAKFVGEWNRYHRGYKWQKLQRHSNSADHSSLGDCRATLEVIRRIAAAPMQKSWHEMWKFWVRSEGS